MKILRYPIQLIEVNNTRCISQIPALVTNPPTLDEESPIDFSEENFPTLQQSVSKIQEKGGLTVTSSFDRQEEQTESTASVKTTDRNLERKFLTE